MATIAKSIDITINRPVEEVFAYLADAANYPNRDSLIVKIEPQEPGPWRVEFRSTVVALEPNRRLETRSLTGPQSHGEWQFSPAGSGTRLHWTGGLQ